MNDIEHPDRYEPNFDLDLRRGSEAEAELRRILGEVIAGPHVEVKRDDRALGTGNVYLESAQRPRGYNDYKPSGLKTSEAHIWGIKIGNAFVVAPTYAWRYVGNRYGLPAETTRGDNPTKGVIIPLADLIQRLNEAPFVTDADGPSA